MRRLLAAVACAILLVTSACAGDDGDDASGRSETSRPATAADLAGALESDVPQIKRAIVITEKNDPNDLIGRPNGYEAAVVLVDGRIAGRCAEIGVACGATLEQFGDADGAKRRSDYILGLLEESPILGSEYHYRRDGVLLRVSGELPPSVARDYEAAFTGASPQSSPAPEKKRSRPSSDERIDVTSGRPLNEFEGSPTYPFRVALAENQGPLLRAMQKIAPHLDQGDFTDVISQCEAIARGLDTDTLIEQAIVRFSGGPDELIDGGQAGLLIGTSKRYVCPA